MFKFISTNNDIVRYQAEIAKAQAKIEGLQAEGKNSGSQIDYINRDIARIERNLAITLASKADLEAKAVKVLAKTQKVIASSKPIANAKVQVVPENVEAIKAILATVQTGRAQNDLSVGKILELATHAEARIARLHVPESRRAGAFYSFAYAGAEAKRYKYAIPTTKVTLYRGPKWWIISSVTKISQFPRNRKISDFALTAEVRNTYADYAVNNI
jgi:wobble nucleotide-excising tRNase